MNILLTACITTIINMSAHPFNKHDNNILMHSKQRCVKIYPNSPCVKKFIKRNINTYWVICGRK